MRVEVPIELDKPNRADQPSVNLGQKQLGLGVNVRLYVPACLPPPPARSGT